MVDAGFEPAKLNAVELKSTSFDRSENPPFLYIKSNL